MISRKDTLKLIKSKVEGRANSSIKIARPLEVKFKEGVFKHFETRRVKSLQKQGNSVFWIDEAYNMRNINILDTKDLHIIMWGLTTEKEKRDIAMAHLLETKDYLTK